MKLRNVPPSLGFGIAKESGKQDEHTQPVFSIKGMSPSVTLEDISDYVVSRAAVNKEIPHLTPVSGSADSSYPPLSATTIFHHCR